MGEPTTTLTFAWLYSRVQEYIAVTKRPVPSKLERWAFWGAFLSVGAGFVVANTWTFWLSPSTALRAMQVFLSIELVGLGISIGLVAVREVPQFIKARKVHAAEMDVDFHKWRHFVDELRQFAPAHREARLRFVQDLRASMDHRMGLAFGGTQKLGIFPVLIALYLQFRNWEWGDWGAAFDVNLVGGLLIWLMLLLYGVGWLLVGLRTRLDTYERLLRESLESEE